MWQAVIGAIAGGMFSSIATGIQNSKLRRAYSSYAKDIENAADQYSGHNADQAIRGEGELQQRFVNNDLNKNRANTSNLSIQNALRNAPTVNNEGRDLGRALKANQLNAQYNANTAKAQAALNQANVNYQAGQQGLQAGLNALGTAASTYKQIAPSQDKIPSDENIKEGYHNKEGIPEADAVDALRQIESIQYKYKDDTGLDQDYHVGTTAQSYEGTAFEDVVKDDNSYKELDKQKLLEAVMAGTAALQKELDELTQNRIDEFHKYNKLINKKRNK